MEDDSLIELFNEELKNEITDITKRINTIDRLINKKSRRVTKSYIQFYLNSLETEKELDSVIEENKENYNTTHKLMLRKRVYNLTTRTYHEQGSEAWLKDREKCISASDAGTSLGMNKYEERYDLILKKCGKGKKFTGNKYTEHGHKYEDVAAQLYQTMNLVDLKFFGLVVHPDKSIPIGASPDGIRVDGVMLEIKVPMTREIIPGEVPPHYEVQTQVQMEVCDLWENDFYETRIVEYDMEDDYYVDSDPDNDRISRDGKIKGIIGQFYHKDTGKNLFLYPPMWATSKEMIKWIEQNIPIFLKNNPDFKYDYLVYWKQTIESCVHVKRDYRRMHEDYVPEFRKVWNEILYHRSNGGKELVSYRDPDEGVGPKIKIKFNAFEDDSDAD